MTLIGLMGSNPGSTIGYLGVLKQGPQPLDSHVLVTGREGGRHSVTPCFIDGTEAEMPLPPPVVRVSQHLSEAEAFWLVF